MTESGKQPLMCSLVSREEDDQLIGTARDVPQFLFIELEKPWASSALQTDHFPEGVFEAYQEGLRRETFSGKFLPIAPDAAYSDDDTVRLLDYRRPDRAFHSYEYTSYVVPRERLDTVTRVLLASPSDREEIESFREPNPPDREIMVCTHRERDPCCGHFGPPVHHALRTHYASDRLRVWQVSHVGGHRYCPNLIDLPDGRYWGRLELGSLENFVHRSGTFRSVSSQYRGWAALSSPEQIVEKAAFEREGWPWISFEKSAETSVPDGADSRYHIEITYRTDRRSGVYRGEVEEGEPVRALQSECGSSEDEPEYKWAPQYRLLELEHERSGKTAS